MKKSRILLMSLFLILALVFSSCSDGQIKLTFDANGGKFADGKETYVLLIGDSSVLTLPDAPSREGYAFSGWYLNSECTESAEDILSKVIAESVTVYAKWVNSAKVTFNSNGGSPVQPQNIEIGSTIETAAVREGYVFNGWYGDKDLTQPVTAVPNQDITVYAGWYNEGLSFQLTDDSSGYEVGKGTADSIDIILPSLYEGLPVVKIAESGFSSSSIQNINIPNTVTEIGMCAFLYARALQSVTIPDSVTKIGVSAFEECDSLESIVIPDSVTDLGGRALSYCDNLKFVKLSENITVLNYGLFYIDEKLKTVTIPDGVTEIGDNVFQNCYDLEYLVIPSGVQIMGSQPFNTYSNMVCYFEADSAQVGWGQNWNSQNPNEFGFDGNKVTFDGNGGTEFGYVWIGGDSEFVMPPNPERDDHIFDGWYFDKDTWQQSFNAQSISEITEDVTVYAKWLAGYNVTFDSNGGDYIRKIVTDGKSNTDLPTPTRKNHIFLGWYLDRDIWQQQITSLADITSDITVYAKWESYTITFVANGGEQIQFETVKTDGQSKVDFPYISKTGYRFDGWYFDDGEWQQSFTQYYLTTNPTENDFTVYAKWVKVYRITFKYDENSTGYSTFDENDPITLPDVTEWGGLVLDGWYLDKDTWQQKFTEGTPATADLTLYAKWI